MGLRRSSGGLRDLRTLFTAGTVGSRSDGELLDDGDKWSLNGGPDLEIRVDEVWVRMK